MSTNLFHSFLIGVNNDRVTNALLNRRIGKLNVRPLVSHRFKLDDIVKAFQTFDSGVGMKIMIHLDDHWSHLDCSPYKSSVVFDEFVTENKNLIKSEPIIDTCCPDFRAERVCAHWLEKLEILFGADSVALNSHRVPELVGILATDSVERQQIAIAILSDKC